MIKKSAMEMFLFAKEMADNDENTKILFLTRSDSEYEELFNFIGTINGVYRSRGWIRLDKPDKIKDSDNLYRCKGIGCLQISHAFFTSQIEDELAARIRVRVGRVMKPSIYPTAIYFPYYKEERMEY